MKNNGLFSSLFIEELKDSIKLDDAAQGRMATLAQTWWTRSIKDTESLWDSFLKQALSYLEFVPPGNRPLPAFTRFMKIGDSRIASASSISRLPVQTLTIHPSEAFTPPNFLHSSMNESSTGVF